MLAGDRSGPNGCDAGGETLAGKPHVECVSNWSKVRGCLLLERYRALGSIHHEYCFNYAGRRCRRGCHCLAIAARQKTACAAGCAKARAVLRSQAVSQQHGRTPAMPYRAIQPPPGRSVGPSPTIAQSPSRLTAGESFRAGRWSISGG